MSLLPNEVRMVWLAPVPKVSVPENDPVSHTRPWLISGHIINAVIECSTNPQNLLASTLRIVFG
jgi:hypothetical protein